MKLTQELREQSTCKKGRERGTAAAVEARTRCRAALQPEVLESSLKLKES